MSMLCLINIEINATVHFAFVIHYRLSTCCNLRRVQLANFVANIAFFYMFQYYVNLVQHIPLTGSSDSTINKITGR